MSGKNGTVTVSNHVAHILLTSTQNVPFYSGHTYTYMKTNKIRSKKGNFVNKFVLFVFQNKDKINYDPPRDL